MGGAITIAIRKNGVTRCQIRGTNPTKGWFCDPRFFEGDQSYLDRYLEYSEKAEWESEFCLAPDGYGMVVADFDTNNLLSMQDYTDYDTMTCSDLENIIRDRTVRETTSRPLYFRTKEKFDRFIEGGRISIKIFTAKDETSGRIETIKKFDGQTFEELIEFTADMISVAKSHSIWQPIVFCDVKTDPLVITRFDDADRINSKSLKEKLLALGFVIDDTAELHWKKWFAGFDRNDEFIVSCEARGI